MTKDPHSRSRGRTLSHSAVRPILPLGIAVSATVVTGTFTFLALALGGFGWLAARSRELA